MVGQQVPPKEGKSKFGWDQDAWRPWELDAVLYGLVGKPDVYLTMNRFASKSKATNQVKVLTCLFSDIDYYKMPELEKLAPEAVLELVLTLLQAAGVPEPSLVLCSGGGLYLVWLLKPVKREELKLVRWDRAQKGLYELLKPLGADIQVRDASRVLRVVGTRNSKHDGGVVHTLQEARGSLWPFDELAQMIPLQEEEQGAEVYDMAEERVARWVSKTGRPGPNGWTAASLWEARLHDLQTLRRLRWGGERMPDFRDRWLFLASVAASWITKPLDSQRLRREMYALAWEVGGWDRRKADQQLREVFKRLEMLVCGQKVEYNGFEWDPRFHFKNQTIMDMLEITAEEERHMLTLISPAEKYRRKVEKLYAKRKAEAAGQMSRSERAAWRRFEACRMAAEGVTFKEIGERLGVHWRSVYRLVT